MGVPITLPSEWLTSAPASGCGPVQAFRQFVAQRDFPCVGAKSALGRGGMTSYVGRDIRSGWDDLPLADALQAFAARTGGAEGGRDFQSFVAIFRGPRHLTEREFERALWGRLQSIHNKDVWLGYPSDPDVSDDPGQGDFSYSVGGRAFFVVGLHPRASRKARRFAYPTLVFNPHHQFQALRAEGRFDRMRQAIRQRDRAWSGSVNPMMSDHGASSEARQYSGRKTGAGWACPFQPRERAQSHG